MSTSYQVHDKSLLAEPFRRFLWKPLLNLVPLSASANTMTLAGTALNVAAALIALLMPPTRLAAALISFLIFSYLCIDNMDGAHARRTGTSSPLGEFLDHWLDGLNGTLMALAAVFSWQIHGLQGLLVVALTGSAYAMTFWEQRWTGRAQMGFLGNIEGIFGVSLMFALQSLLGTPFFCHHPLVLGQSLGALFAWVSVVASLVTTLMPLVRVGRLSDVAGILLGHGVPVLWGWARGLPFVYTAMLLVLITPMTGGRMIVARLDESGGRPSPWVVIGPVALGGLGSILLKPPGDVERGMLLGFLAWTGLWAARDFWRTVGVLARYIKPGELLGYLSGVGGGKR